MDPTRFGKCVKCTPTGHVKRPKPELKVTVALAERWVAQGQFSNAKGITQLPLTDWVGHNALTAGEHLACYATSAAPTRRPLLGNDDIRRPALRAALFLQCEFGTCK